MQFSFNTFACVAHRFTANEWAHPLNAGNMIGWLENDTKRGVVKVKFDLLANYGHELYSMVDRWETAPQDVPTYGAGIG